MNEATPARDGEQHPRIPQCIESDTGRLVYLYLAVTGGASLDDLQDALALDSLTILSVTRDLRERGVVRGGISRYTPA